MNPIDYTEIVLNCSWKDTIRLQKTLYEMGMKKFEDFDLLGQKRATERSHHVLYIKKGYLNTKELRQVLLPYIV